MEIFFAFLANGKNLIKTKGDIDEMETSPAYRHELKYEIGYAQYLPLRHRLHTVMKRDEHAGSDGRYRINSIYFDNMDDKALREKINGTARREKFRIRYYNDDYSLIVLEKKIKDANLTRKAQAVLSEADCRALLRGDTSWMTQETPELVKELYCKMKSQQLRPRVLVSYTREAYVFPAGNVRVTFDSDIRTSLYHQNFLEASINCISAMDSPGEMILEVKYDAFLPEIIALLLQSEVLRQQAYSKYGASRRFG